MKKRKYKNGMKVVAAALAIILSGIALPGTIYASEVTSDVAEASADETDGTDETDWTDETDGMDGNLQALANGPVEIGRSQDAYILYDETSLSWTFGTGDVEKTVQFIGTADDKKKFLMTSYINKLAGNKQYITQPGDWSTASVNLSDEFDVRVGQYNDNHLRGSNAVWKYVSHAVDMGSQGELVLSIVLETTVNVQISQAPDVRIDYKIEVTRHYQILPDTGVIEEWTDYANASAEDVIFSEPRLIRGNMLGDYYDSMRLYYMTGDHVSAKHKLEQKDNLDTLFEWKGKGADGNQPFGALYNKQDEDGVFFTWDYTGSWVAKVGKNGNNKIFAQVALEARDFVTYKSGEVMTTPVARMGVFTGDLDDMGNQINDYQYKYRWNYTNEAYLNLIRFGGYGQDAETLMNKINANRYIGGDMLWIDDGWQKDLGDWSWNGDLPLEDTKGYLEKNGQLLGLWLVPWGASANSDLFVEHPEWSLASKQSPVSTDKKCGLDVALPEVVTYIKEMLDQKQQEFGTFMLKTDFNQYKYDYTRAMAVMDIISTFKRNNPETGLHLCSDGGALLNPGTVTYSELLLLQDGTPGLDDSYWVSMLYPMDKILTVNGRRNIGDYKETNHALLSSAMTVAATNKNAEATMEQLEPIREDCDLYRYLRENGVMGRYVKVYRPTNDTGSTYYFIQKMSKDADKGYITVRFADSLKGRDVTLYPKGLLPDMTYTVSALEGGMETTTKTGAEWMNDGIALSSISLGEVIFLNLEGRPGSGTDTTAPGEPTEAYAQEASYMEKQGVEIIWTAAEDDNWISYYEIEKNDSAYDKVSSGTFYFDKDWQEGDHYRIRTVDGDGNASAYTEVRFGNETVPDKSELQELFETGQGIEKGDYTEESWQAYMEALAMAEAVLLDEDATEQQIHEALIALQRAMDGLQEEAQEPPEKEPETPGGEDPTNPGGEDPTNPGGEAPTNPGGEDPTKPGGEEPETPGGEAPTNPGGEDPTKPGGESPTNPDGKEPANPDSGNPSGSGGEQNPGEASQNGSTGGTTSNGAEGYKTPATGDDNSTGTWLVLGAGSAAMLIATFIQKRRKRHTESCR